MNTHLEACRENAKRLAQQLEATEAEVVRLREERDGLAIQLRVEKDIHRKDIEHLRQQRDRLAELARRARKLSSAPDYDEEAIRDALWGLADAALSSLSEQEGTG